MTFCSLELGFSLLPRTYAGYCWFWAYPRMQPNCIMLLKNLDMERTIQVMENFETVGMPINLNIDSLSKIWYDMYSFFSEFHVRCSHNGMYPKFPGSMSSMDIWMPYSVINVDWCQTFYLYIASLYIWIFCFWPCWHDQTINFHPKLIHVTAQ